MDGYEEGELVIDAWVMDAAVRVDWHGKSNGRNPVATLAPFFERVGDEAAAKKLPVEMHLEALEYFNSSTLSAIIRIMTRLRERTIPVRLRYDENAGWQRRSCEALRVLDTGDGLVQITPAGEE